VAKNPVISSPTPIALLDRLQQSLRDRLVPPLVCAFAGKVVSFEACCKGVSNALTRLFGHLISDGVPDLQVFPVDSSCFEELPFRAGWDWGNIGHNPREGVAWHTSGWDYLTVCDSDRGRAALLARGLIAEDFGRREVMRLLLHKILDFHMVMGIHGATVGDNTTGVLLSNRGGSGKSTLVLAALLQGMRTTGDDFMLTGPVSTASQPFVVSSYFSTIKIYPDEPLAAGLTITTRSDDDKGVLDIPEHFSGGLVRSHRLAAMVIPTIGDKTSSRPASREESLQAILPSSIHLTSTPEKLLHRVHELLDAVPAFLLTVGPNVNEGVHELKGLVEA
jgi:hypothetical protein